MALPAPSLRAVALAFALASAPACVDIVGSVDTTAKYVERDEKHFSTSGTPEVVLSTFDGSIEIRPWDKAEVQVVVEKRGRDKEDVGTIEVHATQSGSRIEVTVTEPSRHGFDMHFKNRSAKLIVSLPPASDVAATSGDGSIDIEHVAGRLQLRSGDGAIQGRSLGGDVTAHTGDGSIKLEGVDGVLNVDTGDGSINVAGRLTRVHARSGDGSVTVHADRGSAAEGDWEIGSGDGSLTLELPEDFSAEVDAHTGDGHINMQDVTLSNVTGSTARDTLRGRLGAGGRNLRLRTGDGSITLRR